MEFLVNCPKCNVEHECFQESFGRYIHCHVCHTDVPVPLVPIQEGHAEGGITFETRLGTGNVSEIFRGYDENGTLLRLKVLSLAASANEDFTAEYIRNMSNASTFSHPGVLAPVECGKVSGFTYIAHPLVEGRTAKDIVDEDGPMAESEVMSLGLAIGMILRHLDEEDKAVHCSVRPSNILITEDGTIYLLDTGADSRLLVDSAPHLRRLEINGSLFPYMSPEQERGMRRPDAAVDMFGLGSTMLYLLTGEHPLHETTTTRIQRRLGQFQHVSASRGMTQLIRKMVAPDDEFRPGSWTPIIQKLERLQSDSGTNRLQLPSPPKTEADKKATWAKAVIGGGVAAILLMIVGMYVILNYIDSHTQKQTGAASTISAEEVVIQPEALEAPEPDLPKQTEPKPIPKPPEKPKPFTFVVEAEDLTGADAWERKIDKDVVYIVHPKDSQDRQPNENEILTQKFEIPKEGLYRIFFKARAIDGSHDSFFVRLKGYDAKRSKHIKLKDGWFTMFAEKSEYWLWTPVRRRNETGAEFFLPPGSYTLEITKREATDLDKIAVLPVPYEPR